MPVRLAARHTDALRYPPYWCVPLLPAGSYRRPPCRRSPQHAVPVRPINRRADSYRRPPRPCVPPTAAPVYFAAAKPVYITAKPPALSRSAVKDTHSIFVLRQESPLHIPFYGKARRSALHRRRKGRRLRLLHCGKNRCGLFCLTRTPQPNRPRPPRRQTRLNPALSPVPPGRKKTAARRMTRRRTFFFCAVRSYMNTTPYTALVNASSAFFLSSKICERSL